MAAAKRVLRYLCSTSGFGLVLGGRSPVVLTSHADASWVDDLAMQRTSQGYTFSLGSGSVSWRSTRSSSVLSANCEAEIYAGAMAAQELRWLTYLLTDLGEPPRSPPVLYVDNKAMLALCREHILEHRTKHIALRYFLAHELQQRGQLRLAYVASEANTADIFTKALPHGDHQRFCTMLGLLVSKGVRAALATGGGAVDPAQASKGHNDADIAAIQDLLEAVKCPGRPPALAILDTAHVEPSTSSPVGSAEPKTTTDAVGEGKSKWKGKADTRKGRVSSQRKTRAMSATKEMSAKTGREKAEENQKEKSVGEGTSAKKGKEKAAEKEKEKV
ncbi:unnamed protein product [Closterium sp. NIES-54]